ncbi:unnamed protein product [Rotaria sordida]|uniref:Uncharacterized protein n=1 Tax=Rotaria sordida TaxID=392033 RepID=A0A815IL25_9BILA|nr:unnamed protein product [Rotaria sordida]
MATTTMITSTPMEDKKKTLSANKHNRSTVARTLKHDPKDELKKDELRQLFEKVKILLSNVRFGRLSGQADRYVALLRDSGHVKEDILNEQIPMNNVYETQPVQLEEVIIQQRKQVETLKICT